MIKKLEKSRVGNTIKNHERGCNCSQAVLCAYCDLFGIDEKTAFRLAEGLGAGMGVNTTCGAVSAMSILAGLKNSDGTIHEPLTKVATYELDKKLIGIFYKKNKSFDCTELKGLREWAEPLRSCNGCIIDCARIVEEEIFTGMFEKYTGEEY
jgi:C_GCAxxG_C_C family probable redox protein